MLAAARAPLRRSLGHVREGLDKVLRVHMGETEGPHAGGVDDAAAVGQVEGHRGGRGVAPASRDVVDMPRGASSVRHQGIHEGGLAHARVADQDRRAVGQACAQVLDARDLTFAVGSVGDGRDEDGHAQRLIRGAQRVARGEVALREHQQRVHARVESGDKAAVDHAGVGLGVG
ncbi:hypothetical protein GCM10025876_27570 [Demequina litorisediminis]|uniref:Uncharacterized protein n=1 Tax=Demequina litorisediminis TaxID=1849022 RepID=A0ABQ6IHC0_9MICO|nr:hypothetical protein GCM10025876_27570 [Demequina litorisediminis]